MTIADILNQYLKTHFDVTDREYLAMIADKNGTPEPTINNPKDFNLGAIANIFEYLRNQGIKYVEQLFFDQAVEKYAVIAIQNIMGIDRFKGEILDDYIDRTRMITVGHKISPASIIFYTSQYSSPGPPVIQQGALDSEFLGSSFLGNYKKFQNLTPGSPEENSWIFPAIMRNSSESVFFFILILENTDVDDVKKVVDTVQRLKSTGIDWELQINR